MDAFTTPERRTMTTALLDLIWAQKVIRDMPKDSYMYECAVDLLCLMALADAFGFEYGDFV